ncbi:MAG: CRISPR-associated endonuclease Cas2 [Lentisphaerota bacterium]
MKHHGPNGHEKRIETRYTTSSFGFGAGEWSATLSDFLARASEAEREPAKKPPRVPSGWWQDAFSNRPTNSERIGHACGAHEMLMIVAYDIGNPRRLHNVAKHCEDYGVRVQYSVFECRLPSVQFDAFWRELQDLIEPKEDRLVAYRICAECAADVRAAGIMELTTNEKVVAYVI